MKWFVLAERESMEFCTPCRLVLRVALLELMASILEVSSRMEFFIFSLLYSKLFSS
jgi:hypothetical protein